MSIYLIILQAVKSKYIERNGEEGQSIVAKIKKNEISLHQTDVDIIPETPWIKNGWELSPLIKPPTVSILYRYPTCMVGHVCVHVYISLSITRFIFFSYSAS